MKRKTVFLTALAMAWSTVAYPSVISVASDNELPVVPVETGVLGDVNGDNHIDASDASEILADYACYATSGNHSLSSANLIYADVDKSGVIDASDASYVLAYYAYIQTGGKLGLSAYIAASSDTSATTQPIAETTKTAVTTTELTTTTAKSTTTAV